MLYWGTICSLEEKTPFLYRHFKVYGQKISFKHLIVLFLSIFAIYLGLDLSTGTRTIPTMIGAMLAPLNVSICIMYYPFTVRIADPVLWMDPNPVLNKAKVRFFNCFRFHGQVGSVFLLVGIDIADPKLQIFLFVSLFLSIPILFTAVYYAFFWRHSILTET